MLQLKVPGTNDSLYDDWIAKFPDPDREHLPR